MLPLRHRIIDRFLLLSVSVVCICACGALQSPPNAPSHLPASLNASTLRVPSFSHIFVIMLENKSYQSMSEGNQAPYFHTLAQQYGSAHQFYGTRHPSLPNYLALTGGDTFGVTSNCTDCFINQPNLVDQLEMSGKTWKGYMESMPSPCFVGDALPLYRQKHNPFIYYDTIRTNPTRCNRIVPFSEFVTDLQTNQLPNFVWITPNMCNDMHDCPISSGDSWLKTWVPQILASPAWRNDGVLFITFDEGDVKDESGCCGNAAGGQIATLVISPLSQPGFASDVAYTHYSMLRTIEASWKLPLLGQANCDCTMPMADFFKPLTAEP